MADLAVLQEKRNKSMIDVSREKQRIAQSKMLSPITGLVSIRQNRGSFSGSFGQQVPDIREGDTLQPGAPVADVLDLSEMEILAKVGELDRANLREGQEVKFVLDAIPDKTFHGKIKGMSGTATANPFGGDPGKKFDVLFSVDMKELMTGLGRQARRRFGRVLETAARNAKKGAGAEIRNFASRPVDWRPRGVPAGCRVGPWRDPGGDPPGCPEAMPGGMQGWRARWSPGGAPGSQAERRAGRPDAGGEAVRRGHQRRAATALFTRMIEQSPPAAKKEIEKEMGGKKMQDLSAEQRTRSSPNSGKPRRARAADPAAADSGGRGRRAGRLRR